MCKYMGPSTIAPLVSHLQCLHTQLYNGLCAQCVHMCVCVCVQSSRIELFVCAANVHTLYSAAEHMSTAVE